MLSIRIACILSVIFLSGCSLSSHSEQTSEAAVIAIADEAYAVFIPDGHEGMWVAMPAMAGEIFFD